MNRLLTIALVLVCTAGLLTYALWDVDLAALGELLANARYAFVAPFLVILVLFFWLKAWRWAMILAPLGRYRVVQVTPALMVGYAANNVLPVHLGELVRAVLFARRYRRGIAAVLVSQVLERLLDVAAVVVLYLLAVAWIDEASATIRSSVWLVALVAALGAGILFALALSPGPTLAAWRALSRPLPRFLRNKGNALLRSVLQALASVRSPHLLLVLLANSLVQWTLMAFIVWLSLRAFGESVTPAVAIIVLAATVVAVTLPNVPGYIGAIQAAFVFALRPFGVPDEIAFAASVFFLVCQWIPVTAVGAVFFVATGMAGDGLRETVREIEQRGAGSAGR